MIYPSYILLLLSVCHPFAILERKDCLKDNPNKIVETIRAFKVEIIHEECKHCCKDFCKVFLMLSFCDLFLRLSFCYSFAIRSRFSPSTTINWDLKKIDLTQKWLHSLINRIVISHSKQIMVGPSSVGRLSVCHNFLKVNFQRSYWSTCYISLDRFIGPSKLL